MPNRSFTIVELQAFERQRSRGDRQASVRHLLARWQRVKIILKAMSLYYTYTTYGRSFFEQLCVSVNSANENDTLNLNDENLKL